MGLYTGDSHFYHAFMKADLRISIKDYDRNKSLKVQLVQPQFQVRIAGKPCCLFSWNLQPLSVCQT